METFRAIAAGIAQNPDMEESLNQMLAGAKAAGDGFAAQMVAVQSAARHDKVAETALAAKIEAARQVHAALTAYAPQMGPLAGFVKNLIEQTNVASHDLCADMIAARAAGQEDDSIAEIAARIETNNAVHMMLTAVWATPEGALSDIEKEALVSEVKKKRAAADMARRTARAVDGGNLLAGALAHMAAEKDAAQ